MKLSSIVKDGREAAYLQVARQLRYRLGEGNLLREDGRLPSFRQLAGEFNVSVCVIQQAMRLLRKEALVEVHHGKSGRALSGAVEAGMLKLALIHPYSSDGPFGRQLPHAMHKALDQSGCNAMLTIRSSGNDPDREREIAENLLYNGFDGIILSPEDSFANTAFFEELSNSIPVMLVDQATGGSLLPAVVVDFADGGDRIGRDLRRRGRTRLLVLLNDHHNSSIEDMLRGLERHIEVRRLALPLHEAEYCVTAGNDYTLWDQVTDRLAEALRADAADAVFSPFEHYLDLMYCNEIPVELQRGRLAVSLCDQPGKFHSRAYLRSRLIEWGYSFFELYPAVLERLLKWRSGGRRPTGVKKLKITFTREYNPVEKEA